LRDSGINIDELLGGEYKYDWHITN
jgi:hypothetical protein